MKQITIRLVDDLDGSLIEEGLGRTIPFSLDGESFKIDLSNENEKQLRAALAPYVAAARSAKATQRSPKSNSVELQKIRDWARAQDIEVSDRGRISAKIREAYAAAR